MACVSLCLLTQGKKNNCAYKTVGGNQLKMYLIPKCQIEGVEWDGSSALTGNIITSITFSDPLDVFYEVIVNKDSLTTVEDVTLPNKFITQTVAFTISNLDDYADLDTAAAEAQKFAEQIINADEGIVAIIEDRTGVKRLWGLVNGLEISAGQKISGGAMGDVAGNTITLTSGESIYAPVVDTNYAFPIA